MGVSLVLALPLIEGETASGFAARNAYRCGVPVRDFCSDMGMRWPMLCAGHLEHLHRLSTLTKADEGALRFWSPQKMSRNRYRVGHAVATTGVMRRTRLRLCPVCAIEAFEATGPSGVYQLLEWSISCLYSCAKHAAPLIELPRARYATQIYDVVTVARGNLDRLRAAADHAREYRPTGFETYVRHRIRSDRHTGWLAPLDLQQLHRACLTLGGTLRGENAYGLSGLAARDACEHGYHVLSGGKSTLTEALEAMHHRQPSNRPYRSSDLGDFYTWIRSVENVESPAPIVDHVHQFVARKYPLKTGHVVFGRKVAEQRLKTLDDARGDLGRGVVFLKRVLGFLNGEDEAGALARTDISIEDVERLEQFFDSVCTYKEAERLLGLRASQLKALVACGGVLSDIQIKSAKTYLKRAEVMALHAAIQSLPKVPNGHEAKQIVDYCRDAKQTIVGLVAQWHKGDFEGAVYRSEKGGIKGLYIEASHQPERQAMPLMGDLTLLEAARYLQINIRGVRALRDAKLVAVEQRVNPKTNQKCSYVTEPSIRMLEQKYVTLGKLSSRLLTAPIHLARRLDREGVSPVSIKGAQIRLYEIGQLERSGIV